MASGVAAKNITFTYASNDEIYNAIKDAHNSLNKTHEKAQGIFSHFQPTSMKKIIGMHQAVAFSLGNCESEINQLDNSIKIAESITRIAPGLLKSLNSLMEKKTYSKEDRILAENLVIHALLINTIANGQSNLKDALLNLALLEPFF